MSSCFDIKNACFTIEFSSFSHRYEKYFNAFFIRNIWIGNLPNSPLAARFDAFRFNSRYCLQNFILDVLFLLDLDPIF